MTEREAVNGDSSDGRSRMRWWFAAAVIVMAHVGCVQPWLAAMLVGATGLVWAGAEASARRRWRSPTTGGPRSTSAVPWTTDAPRSS